MSILFALSLVLSPTIESIPPSPTRALGLVAPALVQQHHAWREDPRRTTIYLNFSGGIMEPGGNPALNQSHCINGVGTTAEVPPFGAYGEGSEADAFAIIALFEEKFEPYGVRIVYEEAPPPELPYTMVVIAGSTADEYQPADASTIYTLCNYEICGNNPQRNTVFAYEPLLVGNFGINEPNVHAVIGATARTFGLGYTSSGGGALMELFPSSGASFSDSCEALRTNLQGWQSICSSWHEAFCEEGFQNSDAELVGLFGPNSPDTEPPTVEITNPASDEVDLEVGGSISIEANIEDNYGGAGWKLVIPELGEESIAFLSEREWFLSNLPEGEYTVRVEAIDHDRNIGSDEFTLRVGGEPPRGDGTTGAESMSGTSMPGSTSSGEDMTSGPTPDPAPPAGETTDGDTEHSRGGSASDDGGCSVVTAPATGFSTTLLLLLLLGGRRRDSACRSHSRTMG